MAIPITAGVGAFFAAGSDILFSTANEKSGPEASERSGGAVADPDGELDPLGRSNRTSVTDGSPREVRLRLSLLASLMNDRVLAAAAASAANTAVSTDTDEASSLRLAGPLRPIAPSQGELRLAGSSETARMKTASALTLQVAATAET